MIVNLMIIKSLTASNNKLIRCLTVLSGLIASWIIYRQHGQVVNVDSALYLEVAKRFSLGDYQGGLALYNWPLFPVLIALTHKFSGLSLQYSGHLLEMLFFMLTTWSLLQIVQEGGGGRLAILSGAALLSSSYIVGDVLRTILREQGFWAFYLLGLLFFYRFYQRHRLADAIAWQAAAMIATLFRIEAISFLILLPTSLLFLRNASMLERLKYFAQAHSLNLAVLLTLVIATLGFHVHDLMLGRLPEVYSRVNEVYAQLSHGLTAKAQLYADHVLSHELAGYALQGFILTLLFVLAAKIGSVSGWLVIGLSIFALRQNNLFDPKLKTVLVWLLGINLLNVFTILLNTYLMAGRYLVGIALLLIIMASYQSAKILREARTAQSTPAKVAVGLALLYVAANFLVNLAQRDLTDDYRQHAVAWVKHNTDPNTKIYYDEVRLRYYATASWDSNEDMSWPYISKRVDAESPPYDYLVIHVSKRQITEKPALVISLKHYRIVYTIRNRLHNEIIILKRSADS